MQPFIPQKIFLESGVESLPLTRRVLEHFPQVPVLALEDSRQLKVARPIAEAKRLLVLARLRGEAVKPFPKVAEAINFEDYVFNPVSNCHLECTYCVLQSYLKNNPAITFFADPEPFFSGIHRLVTAQPAKTFRVGTGELSDSLATDAITAWSREWVPFFSDLPNAFLELKTKSDSIDNLLDLEHRGRTVISFSLAPEVIARREELKCATPTRRLESAQRVQAQGYPVGLHLDPLIFYENWENDYQDLVQSLSRYLNPRRIAWVSLGSLRFDRKLKAMATDRFQTSIFSGDFVSGSGGKMRYFKTLRLNLYRRLWTWLRDWSEDFPIYLCMEPSWMWEQVTARAAPLPGQVEATLVSRLCRLQREV